MGTMCICLSFAYLGKFRCGKVAKCLLVKRRNFKQRIQGKWETLKTWKENQRVKSSGEISHQNSFHVSDINIVKHLLVRVHTQENTQKGPSHLPDFQNQHKQKVRAESIVLSGPAKHHISDNIMTIFFNFFKGQRINLAAKSTYCSCRRPRFKSQHLYGDS